MEYETLKEKRKKTIITVLFIAGVFAIVVLIVFELVLLLKKDGKISRPASQNLPVSSPSDSEEPHNETPYTEPTPTPEPEPEDTFETIVNTKGNTIITRFNPPAGYTRVEVEEGSFADYLRNYPLKNYGEKALLFSGAESDQASLLGVFSQNAPLNKNQQCADTVIMLYGEYLYGRGRYDEISFNFLSGFACDFSHWIKGYRPKVDGKNVEWVLSTDSSGVKADDKTYSNFVSYLKQVYVYANTDSLAVQYPLVKNTDDLKIGDVFIATAKDLKAQAALIDPSAPDTIEYGHAIIIADMAVNEKGEKVYLFIEGTTPATECCVVENPDGKSFCWFKFDGDGTFVKGKSGIRWLTSWGHSLTD